MLGAFALCPAASAAVYLVGAQLYSCSADGTNGGPGAYGPEYQYATNSATVHNPLVVNGDGSAIAIALADGSNPIDFTTGGIDPGDFACINLFFDSAAVSYNPIYVAGVGIPGDLVAVAAVAGSGFSVPAAGTNVQSYNSSSFSVNTTSYSGASNFTVGGRGVFVSSFIVNQQIGGTIGLHVPEPGETASGVAAGIALAAAARRRTSRFRGAFLR